MKYSTFFGIATGGHEPYPYQERFATADALPHLLRAPTGAGKTATAVLGWLFRRLKRPTETPRRLVYCLPMRVLVEQSFREAKNWIAKLESEQVLKEQAPVHLLMGGIEADREPWYLHPERPAILIGTQDMLLSRALNRGYAASRFHWPIDFGLLNNDCLWVFDEPQLMAGGVSTSAQLAGLRSALKTFGPCPSIWMSATLEPGWLNTVDFAGKFPAETLELEDADYAPQFRLRKRMTAEKTLESLGVTSSKDMKDVANQIWNHHAGAPGAQTLVVVNTVARAKAVFAELGKLRKKSASPALLLVHSRFRPKEREALNAALQSKEPGDRIVVATQVVEAGVDITSRTLYTELAPWPSIVQRVGRCNRTGDDGPGQVFWIELDEKLSPPYAVHDLDFARDQLEKLEGENVSPKDLDDFKLRENITLPFEHKHVLRRPDLLDLFDTAPDLSGNDIDIQRFVRSDDLDSDVQVFWRHIQSDGPNLPRPQAEPHRQELCSVPLKSIKEFLSKKAKGEGFTWDHLDGEWKVIRDPNRELRPGLEILLPTTVGGYSPESGWDPDSSAEVEPCPYDKNVQSESLASDFNSLESAPLSISQHTQNVCRELADILSDPETVGNAIQLPEPWPERLAKAARWHDVGKVHKAFAAAMQTLNGDPPDGQHWAKSGKGGRLRYDRKYFRHELASALAVLQQQFPFAVAYLVAAHHGRPRLAIRALPDETEPSSPDMLFALGVHDGDKLESVDLGGETCPALTLDLSPMQLGGDVSWTAAALQLLGELGPFRLSYLEALLRAADVRASKKEAENRD